MSVATGIQTPLFLNSLPLVSLEDFYARKIQRYIKAPYPCNLLISCCCLPVLRTQQLEQLNFSAFLFNGSREPIYLPILTRYYGEDTEHIYVMKHTNFQVPLHGKSWDMLEQTILSWTIDGYKFKSPPQLFLRASETCTPQAQSDTSIYLCQFLTKPPPYIIY